MKVFMIGGTGLLGSEAAKVLIERGHEVTSVALPPLPEGAVLPPEMKIEYGDIDYEFSESEEPAEGFASVSLETGNVFFYTEDFYVIPIKLNAVEI